jgi:hypothetical protein
MNKYRIVPGEAPGTWVIERAADATSESEPLLLFDTREEACLILDWFFAQKGSVGAARTPIYLVGLVPGFGQDVDGHLFLARATILRSRKILESAQRGLPHGF